MFPRWPVDDLLENGIISKACYSFVSLFHIVKFTTENQIWKHFYR